MNEYTRKLVQNGVEVTVIAGRNSQDVPAVEQIDGIHIYRLDTNTKSAVSVKPTIFGYRALRLIDHLCNKKDIDILHLISFPNLGAVLTPVPWLESPPVLIADTRSTAVRNAVFDYISRKGIQLQDRLVDRSIVIDERVGENVLGPGASYDVVPLGVDMEAFTPGNENSLRQEWGVEDDDIVIGYTGSLHKPRQLDRAIDAFGAVHNRHSQTKFVIVGSGTDKEALESHARKSGLAEAIHFTGEIPFENMPRYVRAFDIGFAYVPDRPQYRDQPPLKTVEFLSSRLPIVATDTPGNKIFVTDSENAIVVEDDVSSYCRAMSRLVESPSLRESLQKNARESVREFDYEHIVKNRLIPVYESALEKYS